MMSVRDMPVGPEMDGLVATFVMGWAKRMTNGRFKRPNDDTWHDMVDYIGSPYSNAGIEPGETWNPSEDIAHAWQVVEKMSSTTKETWELKHGSCMEEALFTFEGGRDLPWTIGEHLGRGNDAVSDLSCCITRCAG